jgi:hypothetical protein
MFDTAGICRWPFRALVDVEFAGHSFPSKCAEALESARTLPVVRARGAVQARAFDGDNLGPIDHSLNPQAAVIDVGAASEGGLVGGPISRGKCLVETITLPELLALAGEGSSGVGALRTVSSITTRETLETLINVFLAVETLPALIREGGGAVAAESTDFPEVLPRVGASTIIQARAGGTVVDIDAAVLDTIILTGQPTVVVRGGDHDRSVGDGGLVKGVAISLETGLALASILSLSVRALCELVANIGRWVSLLFALVDLVLAIHTVVSEGAIASVGVNLIFTVTSIEAREADAVESTFDDLTSHGVLSGSFRGLKCRSTVHSSAFESVSLTRGLRSAAVIGASITAHTVW